MKMRPVAAYSLVSGAWVTYQRRAKPARWLVVITLRGWSDEDVAAAGASVDADEIDPDSLGEPTIEAKTEIETQAAMPLIDLQAMAVEKITEAASGSDGGKPIALIEYGRVDVFELRQGRKR